MFLLLEVKNKDYFKFKTGVFIEKSVIKFI